MAARSSVVLAMLVVGSMLVGVGVLPAAATQPGGNGDIVYMREGAIWVMGPDGSGQQEVLAPSGPLRYLAHPTWSPDGTRIAFEAADDVSQDIYVVDAMGTNVVNLTMTPSVDESSPAWSPDGSSIAYAASFDLWAVTIATGVATNLTAGAGPTEVSSQPAWSPDGARIAYMRFLHSGGQTGLHELHVGTGAKELIAAGTYGAPSWSPDGSQIVAVKDFHLIVMNADGSDEAILIPESVRAMSLPGGEGSPVWSPDGQSVAFASGFRVSQAFTTNWIYSWSLQRGELDILDKVSWDFGLSRGGLGSPDWLAVAAHTTGLVDPASGQWHLRDTAGYWSTFYFGNPGDYPMVGDWDCDGIETPGLYRQADGFVYLRNSNDQGTADIRFYFGDPGDIPLAGDFNNDGCDTVSIYRPTEGRAFIINKLGANEGGLGAAEYDYYFGDPGDKPFCGDFNGTGTETVGLHRESTGFVYFRQSHTQGAADSQFFYGDPGDQLISGDWGTVDGVFTMGIYRPSTLTTYLRYVNTQGTADASYLYGEAAWVPVGGYFG